MKTKILPLLALLFLASFAFAAQDSTQPATSDNPPPPPIFCYDNSDCPAGYLCVNETCLQQLPTCGDGACNNGETCSTCAADCGACPPGGGGGGSGGHDPPPMRPTYPPYPPPVNNQTPPAGNGTQNDSQLAQQAPPASQPSTQQPSQNNEVPDKQLQKQDIISDIAKALNLDGFFNTLAAAIGNIPPALVIGVFALFVIAGAAGGYIFLTRKKEGK